MYDDAPLYITDSVRNIIMYLNGNFHLIFVFVDLIVLNSVGSCHGYRKQLPKIKKNRSLDVS